MVAIKDRPRIVSHPSKPMVPTPATITHIKEESSNTSTYTLQIDDPQLRETYRFQPGQFNMLYLFGLGEAAISLSGDPEDHGNIVHTIRHCGSVTFGLGKLAVGSKIGIRGPFGNGWPLDAGKGRDIILIAGGIGLAPLRPAVHQILANRSLYGRVILVYGGRAPADLLYQKELEVWNDHPDIDALVTVDYPQDDWSGPVGVVTDLLKRIRLRGEQVSVMICGPRIMNRFVAWMLVRLHVPEEHVFVSLERNMRCGLGRCGHCQYGPKFVCKDGPVFAYKDVKGIFAMKEI